VAYHNEIKRFPEKKGMCGCGREWELKDELSFLMFTRMFFCSVVFLRIFDRIPSFVLLPDMVKRAKRDVGAKAEEGY
jgi:hypothetical protein